MTTSSLPSVIDYLVGTFTAAPGIGAATPPVAVYDGPSSSEPGLVDRALYVAMDDPGIGTAATTGAVAGTVSWEWASLGAQRRYEQIAVPCVILCVDAGGNMRAARTLCTDLYATVDALIVPGDVSMGGRVLYVTGLSEGTMRTDQFSVGAVAWLTFAFECKARI